MNPPAATNLPSDPCPWIKIRLPGLVRLVNAPLPLRWRWATELHHGRKRMVLVSPRGSRWAFRLNRGAWLQRLGGAAVGSLDQAGLGSK